MPGRRRGSAGAGPERQAAPALPAVLADAGHVDTVVIAAENLAEATLAPDVQVVGAGTLAEVIVWLHGGRGRRQPPS